MKRKKKSLFEDLCSWAGCICDRLIRPTYVLQTWEGSSVPSQPWSEIRLGTEGSASHFDSSSFLETSKRNQIESNRLKLGVKALNSPILGNPEGTIGSIGGSDFYGGQTPQTQRAS